MTPKGSIVDRKYNIFIYDIFIYYIFICDIFIYDIFIYDIFMYDIFIYDIFIYDTFCIHIFYLDIKGGNLDTETLFVYRAVQVHPLDGTTHRDSYAWNYRELVTLLTLSESLAEVGLELLTIRSMRKNLTIELS